MTKDTLKGVFCRLY